MIKRHKTKYTVVTSLKYSSFVLFDSRENAMSFAFEHGYAIYPPIYG